MSEHLFLYRIKDSDDRDCCAYIDAAGPKFVSAQLDYVEVVILVGSFLSMKKLKQFSQKMNMKKLFHSIYLLKHLIMESRRVITDIKQVLNLLILSSISMTN